MSRENALPKIGTIHYHAQLGLSGKNRTIKGFFVFVPAKWSGPRLVPGIDRIIIWGKKDIM